MLFLCGVDIAENAKMKNENGNEKVKWDEPLENQVEAKKAVSEMQKPGNQSDI